MRAQMLIPLLAIFCAPVAMHAAEPVCERSASRSTPSPDGSWMAEVQEEVCTTATGGAAAGITVVLSSSRDQALRKRVFLMPVPRSRDDWPRIRWHSADAVELRVANLSEAPAPEPQFKGIHITLTFCGDNPGDRAQVVAYKAAVQQWQKDVSAWATLRKQNAEAAGTRPPRPAEPTLAPGRCTE